MNEILFSLLLFFPSASSSYAQTYDNPTSETVYESLYKSTDIPQLKCSDKLGGYYIFYNLKKIDERGTFIFAYPIPKKGAWLGYALATESKDLSDPKFLKFNAYDPMQGSGIYEMKIDVKEKNLTLFSQKTKKMYQLKCTTPIKGDDYD